MIFVRLCLISLFRFEEIACFWRHTKMQIDELENEKVTVNMTFDTSLMIFTWIFFKVLVHQ